MAHSLPDYTTKYKLVRLFSNMDFSEFAARINQMVVYDRRGNIIWFDDFEGGTLCWVSNGSGVGNTEVLSTDQPFIGSQCCKITTGNLNNDYGGIVREFQRPPTSQLGIEISFTSKGNIDRYELQFTYFTGTTSYTAYAGVDTTTHTLFYYDAAGAYQTLASNVLCWVGNYFYHTMKLVVDFSTGNYVRFLFANRSYDMAGIPMRTGVSAEETRVLTGFRCQASANGGHSMYVDRFIFTENDI